ncbi:Lipopolysaccharide export system permease protein LptF [Flavimaricola marinus]|uniref:Lipopolysaccharide export system permease protein LptF n=2 Tax=Flavimaricola marinus TaxID=1819565 RepID=A0A238LKY9_9RHOB|nr:Lipopolysaccharide export system permease protein LptF [Flavimaricola marinus]
MVLFGFFSLILILMYWVNRAVVLFDQLIADGQSIGVFLTFSALTLPGLIRIVLPLSAFAAALYVANRMIAESELIVVQATGFSPFRLARPMLVFGVIVALLMSILVHYLVPASVTELNRRQTEIAQNATARLLREGQFLSPVNGVTLYIREITPEGELRDIFLSDTRASAESVTYTASSAYVVRTEKGPQLVMIDGMAQTLRADSDRLITTAFADLVYDVGAMIQLPDTSRRSSREVMTHDLLRPTPALATETEKTEPELYAEGHSRIAESLLGLIAPLIGFATLLVGGFSRFGVWRQMVSAIFLLVLIKMIESVTTNAVRADPSLWALVYLPSFCGLLLTTGLLSWSMNPAVFRRRIPEVSP